MIKQIFWLITAITFVTLCPITYARTTSLQIQNQLSKLEKEFNGKIGVYAINTNNNQIIAYRANERFPVQSTFKVMGVAALLNESNKTKNLLQEKINYNKNDLTFWHPITGKYITTGLTLESLAEAAISFSDNTAANLITKKLGGPHFIENFAHTIGNQSYNVEHYECHLNSNPKDISDTATPQDMAISLQKLILGNILTEAHRTKLINWMRDNAVGYKRIRAGVPIGWMVADKTGSGDYGIANDIGVVWSPVCKPIVLAIYSVQINEHTKSRDDIVASATKTILDEFASNDPCFKELT